MTRYVLLLVVFCAYSANMRAQDTVTTARDAKSEADIPRVTIDFDKPQKVAFGSKGALIGGNSVCSEDGTVFLEASDSDGPNHWFLALHSLDPSGKTIRFDAGHMQGYIDNIASPSNFFVGETRVVILTDAEPEKISLADKLPAPVQLALIFDRKGAFQKAVRMPDNMHVNAVGIYDSGDLLAISTNSQDKSAHLLIIGESGGIDRELRLFDEDYNLIPHAKEDQLFSSAPEMKEGVLSMMQIVPYGQNLLLVPSLSRQSVLEVNERGIVRVHQLQIPKGFSMDTLLSTSGHRWKITTTANDVQAIKVNDSDRSNYSYSIGPLFEFDPDSGAVLRRIDKSKGKDGFIACEHNGEYTVFTTDANDGSLEILKASVPK